MGSLIKEMQLTEQVQFGCTRNKLLTNLVPG